MYQHLFDTSVVWPFPTRRPQPAGNLMSCCFTLIQPHIHRERQLFTILPKKWRITQVTQAFYINKITVNTETKKIEIEGTKRQYIDDRKVEDGKKKLLHRLHNT